MVVDYYQSSSSQQQKTFADYPIWGDDLGSDFHHLAEGRIFFPQDFYQTTIQSLLGVHCTVPNCSFGPASPPVHRTVPQLQNHLRQQHRLTLCTVCVDHQRDFVAKLPRYSPSGLSKHRAAEHCVCAFCPSQTFYDLTALYVHCQAEHYKCHLCEGNLQIPNEYYRNYQSLERHFDRQHFLCQHPQCLSARFMVFFSELDYQHHERVVHGIHHSAGSTKLQLEFRFHRRPAAESDAGTATPANQNHAMEDGTPFVPPALPRTTSADTTLLHPEHAARTEQLRQQATALRSETTVTTEFPSLRPDTASAGAAPTNSQTTSGPSRLTIGWAADGTQRLAAAGRPGSRITDADFPSLPTTTPAKTKKAASLVGPRQPRPGTTAAKAAGTPGWTTVPSARIKAAPSSMAVRVAPPVRSHHQPPPILAAYQSSSGAAKPAAAKNQPVDVADASHFPALGVPKPSAPYPAALAYAATRRNDSRTAVAPSARRTNGGPTTRAPNVASVESFPSLSISEKKQQNVRPVPSTSTARIPAAGGDHLSIADLKGVLGPIGYKSLKQYSRSFAQRDLDAESYVDHVAALFPHGYGDPCFVAYVPALIRSSPAAAEQQAAALRYMSQLAFLPINGSSS
jgi:E3 ubiquitin-protein ligase ZNF598